MRRHLNVDDEIEGKTWVPSACEHLEPPEKLRNDRTDNTSSDINGSFPNDFYMFSFLQSCTIFHLSRIVNSP